MFTDLLIRSSKYGWVPDLPDQRDLLYQKLSPYNASLPSQVDLRSECPPVFDQGHLGSCTANALVGNLEVLEEKSDRSVLMFSRLFLYYNERAVRRMQSSDSGASLRDGIKTLVKAGDCLESDWPYVISDFAQKPNDAAYQNALLHQVTAYYRILSTNEMKHTLSQGFPFVFGFAVYDSFESEEVAKTGRVSLPSENERMIGGHAVLAVGYDDESSCFIVRNSWGEAWGDQGYFYMPYDYLANTSLASDFWTIRKLE